MTDTNNAAKHLGALGGKASAHSRLGGKTKEERSAAMKKVRNTKTKTYEL